VSNNTFDHIPEIYNTDSPSRIVPKLLEHIKPASVVDVGCGLGAWLKVFQDNGVGEVLGMDGGWVDKNKLLISRDLFKEIDLTNPVFPDKKFDLVLCLEVVEHVPEKKANEILNFLSDLGEEILFSAAIPHQLGEGHINLQWPEYWIAKFKGFGYKVYDIIRPQIWSNQDIHYWYKQNTFFFSRKDYQDFSKPELISAVHPQLYCKKVDTIQQYQSRIEDIYSGRISFWKAMHILKKCIMRKITLYAL